MAEIKFKTECDVCKKVFEAYTQRSALLQLRSHQASFSHEIANIPKV